MTNGDVKTQPAVEWICNHCEIILFYMHEDSLIVADVGQHCRHWRMEETWWKAVFQNHS